MQGKIYRRLADGLLAGLLCGLVLLSGCTVFENRSVCPNYLALDMEDVDPAIKEWQMWLFSEDGQVLLKDTIYRRSYSSPYIVEVPRCSNVKCLMWGNMRGATQVREMNSYGTYLAKLEDVSADSLYFFTETVDTRGETSSVKVLPAKEFATVDIYIKGWAGTDYQASLVLECASAGFYVSKEFLGWNTRTVAQVYDMQPYYTQFRCRMWRQQDTENMVLKLYIRDLQMDGTLVNVLVDKEVPIGEYLFENGYDMQAASLEDIEMEVDYSYNRFVIRADNWEATYNILEEI